MSDFSLKFSIIGIFYRTYFGTLNSCLSITTNRPDIRIYLWKGALIPRYAVVGVFNAICPLEDYRYYYYCYCSY